MIFAKVQRGLLESEAKSLSTLIYVIFRIPEGQLVPLRTVGGYLVSIGIEVLMALAVPI